MRQFNLMHLPLDAKRVAISPERGIDFSGVNGSRVITRRLELSEQICIHINQLRCEWPQGYIHVGA